MAPMTVAQNSLPLGAFGGQAHADAAIGLTDDGSVRFPMDLAWVFASINAEPGTYRLAICLSGARSLRCELLTQEGAIPLPLAPRDGVFEVCFRLEAAVKTLRLLPPDGGTVRFDEFSLTRIEPWISLLPEWQLGSVLLPHRQGAGSLTIPPARPAGWGDGFAIDQTERLSISGNRCEAGPSGALRLAFQNPLAPGTYRVEGKFADENGEAALVEPRMYTPLPAPNSFPAAYLRPTDGARLLGYVHIDRRTEYLTLQPRQERGTVCILDFMVQKVGRLRFARAMATAALRSGIQKFQLPPPRPAASRIEAARQAGWPADPRRVDTPSAQARARPLVSILTPTKDAPDHLARFLTSLRETRYPAYELILVDNGTTDERAARLLREVTAQHRADVLRDARPFNFAALINGAAHHACGEILVLANNDIEFSDPGWLDALVSAVVDGGVGVAGALLNYPNGRIQHAGMFFAGEARVRHWERGAARSRETPGSPLRHLRPVTAVTGALLAVRTQTFRSLEGLDAARYPVLYNDVDFCLRAGRAGHMCALALNARAVHHESITFGSKRTTTLFGRGGPIWRMERAQEADRFRQDWSGILDGDPWYNGARDLPSRASGTES